MSSAPRNHRSTGFLAYVILVFPLADPVRSQRQDLIFVQENVISENYSVEEAKYKNIFKPTNEWKTIEPDQAIPPGLHVRMNLATGVREARLMENHDSEAGGSYRSKLLKNQDKYDWRELEALLKNIDKGDSYSDSNVVGKLDKSIAVKTDAEIISSILSHLKDTQNTDEQIVELLDELEYYLHQYDNGINFVDKGGIDLFLHLFNSTSQEVISSIGLALGSAASSNPTVKNRAVESGFVPVLIKCLVSSKEEAVKLKCMFAAANLIRNNEEGQKKFVNHGGASSLKLLLSSAVSRKLKQRVLHLLQDLLMEKSDPYLIDTLVHDDICSTVANLFSMVSDELIMKKRSIQSEMDYLVDLINVLNPLTKSCDFMNYLEITNFDILADMYGKHIIANDLEDVYESNLLSSLIAKLKERVAS